MYACIHLTWSKLLIWAFEGTFNQWHLFRTSSRHEGNNPMDINFAS